MRRSSTAPERADYIQWLELCGDVCSGVEIATLKRIKEDGGLKALLDREGAGQARRAEDVQGMDPGDGRNPTD